MGGVLDEKVSLLGEVRISLCLCELYMAAGVILLRHIPVVPVAVVECVVVAATTPAVWLVEVVMVVKVGRRLRVQPVVSGAPKGGPVGWMEATGWRRC